MQEASYHALTHNPAAPWRRFFADSTVRLCLVIFLVGMAERLLILRLTQSYLAPENCEVVNIAISLATRQQFANAFGHQSGPTAHVSPIYPLLLSIIYKIFGHGLKGEVAQEVFSSFIACLLWSLMPLVSNACGLNRRIGVWAGFLGAFLPINRWAENKGAFETALAALSMVLLFISYLEVWRVQEKSNFRTCALGMLGGVAVLVSATVVAAVTALLLTTCVLFRQQKRRLLRFLTLNLIGMLAVMSPWAARNYFVLGAPVWTRSNFGLELQVSNNDLATVTFADNARAMKTYHPHENASERRRVMALGEPEYGKQKQAEALHWIAGHPQRFLVLTTRRFFYFWFPRMKRWIQIVPRALFTIFGLAGLFLLRRRSPEAALALSLIVLLYPFVYYIVQAQPRYVYPIEWMLYFLTAYLAWFLRSYSESRAVPQEPSGPVLAA